MKIKLKILGIPFGLAGLVGCGVVGIVALEETSCYDVLTDNTFTECKDGVVNLCNYSGVDGALACTPTSGNTQCTTSNNPDGSQSADATHPAKSFHYSSSAQPLFPRSATADAGAPIYLPLPFGPLRPSGQALNTPPCNPATAPKIIHVRYTGFAAEIIGTCPASRLAVFQVNANPLRAQVAPDQNTALITSSGGTITFVDMNGLQSTGTVTAPSGISPSGLAITQDGKQAYITSYNTTSPGILMLDLAKRTFSSLIPTPPQPQSAILNPDGSQLYVTFPTQNLIQVYDTMTNALVTSIAVTNPLGLAFNPTGTRAYVASSAGASQPGSLVSIDTTTYTVLKTYPVGVRPIDIMVTPDGRRVFVANFASTFLSVLDTATDQVTSVPMGGTSLTALTLIR